MQILNEIATCELNLQRRKYLDRESEAIQINKTNKKKEECSGENTGIALENFIQELNQKIRQFADAGVPSKV